MSDETIKAYYSLSTDIWRFAKRQLESLQNTEEWWDETYKKANELLKKHEQILNEDYIRQKINAEIKELSRLCKEKGGENG